MLLSLHYRQKLSLHLAAQDVCLQGGAAWGSLVQGSAYSMEQGSWSV